MSWSGMILSDGQLILKYLCMKKAIIAAFAVCWVVLSAFAVSLVSCSGSSDQAGFDIKSEAVCVLDENLLLLDAPTSSGVVEGNGFMVAAGDDIILYGFDGQQLSLFSKKGRGRYEYQTLSYVRGEGDKIYVWDSGRTSFIVYDRNGDGMAEYKYGSAIKDFLPHEDKLYIYTAGKRADHIIDVFDMTSCSVVDSLVASTPEHRLLLSNEATAPMSVYDGYLCFMPKGALDIYRWPLSGGEVSKVGAVSSETFKVDKIGDNGIVGRDFMKAARYLFSNSYTLTLSAGRKGFMVLANEGTAELDKSLKVTEDNLTMNLYRIDDKLGHLKESAEERVCGC